MKEMKMNNQNEQNQLFPLTYKSKSYYEKDCDDVFLTFYFSPMALNHKNGVYMAEGLWVYPDGEMASY
ncbi:hypothetical protein [Psychroflexus planctonicus]|uniref:Uncharacterized protein n=1 Tax=Psychroflexus planctonicus TaxID=1526575 RepID=A0ABQ1SCH2_9FLAO|nr:hypothetical protein [Psychroflexus planctonicus]GGE27203.1 hypothetical protein GCM10010832_04950 [Psychroflexus planctonicus]